MAFKPQFTLQRYTAGFTLVEVMVALVLSTIIGTTAIAIMIHSARVTKTGGNQARYTALARKASHRITRSIENAKAVGATTNSLQLFMTDMTLAEIRFDDGGDPGDVESNNLLYFPNISDTNFYTLSSYVTPVPGEAMFGMVPTSPRTARIVFRVGDGSNDSQRAFSQPNEPLQGVEVRVSATPRNLQRWYESP
jgi:prepilin-type N-terminal cleavage/methylation domain-containing protein